MNLIKTTIFILLSHCICLSQNTKIKFNVISADSDILSKLQTLNNSLKSLDYYNASKSYLELTEHYLRLGNTKKAIDYIFKSIEINSYLKSEKLIAKQEFYLGEINVILGKFEKALTNYKQAKNLFLSQRNNLELAKAFSGISNAYINLNNFNNAINFLNSSDSILSISKYEKDLKVTNNIRRSICIFSSLGIDSSIKILLHAETEAKKFPNFVNNSVIYNNLALLYIKKQNPKKASIYLKKGENASKSLNNHHSIASFYYTLSEYYKLIGEYKNALLHHIKYTSLKDSIKGAHLIGLLNYNQYEYELKRKEIETLQSNKLIKLQLEAQNNQQKMILITVVSIFILVIAIIILIIRSKGFRLLAEAKSKILDLQKKRIVITTETQEHERKVIAAELHDNFGSQVIGIKLLIANSIKLNDLEKKNEKIQLAISQMDHLANQIRNFTHTLFPISLEEKGLVYSINELATNLFGSAQIEFLFEHKLNSSEISKTISFQIFRITQEIFVNIIKHSKANFVQITLYTLNNNLLLFIEDNGIGISNLDMSNGIGLKSIKKRLNLINGEIDIESISNSGALIKIKVLFQIE